MEAAAQGCMNPFFYKRQGEKVLSLLRVYSSARSNTMRSTTLLI